MHRLGRSLVSFASEQIHKAARWPLDHNYLTYERCFGDVEWPAYVAFALIFGMLTYIFFKARISDGEKDLGQYEVMSYTCFVVASNVTLFITYPAPDAFASTLRSYLLIVLAVLRALLLIGAVQQVDTEDGCFLLLHSDLVLQSVLLPGYWQLLTEHPQASISSMIFCVYFLWYGGIFWIFFPICNASGGDKQGEPINTESSKSWNGPLKRSRRRIYYGIIDTILLLLVQHG